MLSQVERTDAASDDQVAELLYINESASTQSEGPYVAADHLEDALELVRLHLAQYVRRGPEGARPAGLQATSTPDDAQRRLVRLRTSMAHRVAATEHMLPLEAIRRRFRLSEDELLVVVTTASAQLSFRTQNLLARVGPLRQDPAALPVPFLCSVLGNTPAQKLMLGEALTPSGRLIASGLLTVVQSPGQTPHVHAPAELVSFLRVGEVSMPLWATRSSGTRSSSTREAAPEVEALVVHAETRPALVTALRAWHRDDHAKPLWLLGRRGVGRRTLLTAYLGQVGRDVVVVSPPTGMTELQQIQAFLYEAVRLARLSGAALLVRGDGVLEEGGALESWVSALRRLASECHWPVAIGARGTEVGLARAIQSDLTVHLKTPEPEALQTFWARRLGESNSALAEIFASRFSLTPGRISSACPVVTVRRARRTDTAVAEQVTERIQALLDRDLAPLAERVTVRPRWESLVLEERTERRLEQIIDQVELRRLVIDEWGLDASDPGSRGVTCLFSGPPGTGKTLSAATLANRLGVALYRVDLAQVTSKWVGETEKQLGRLLDAAEDMQIMLLFDEADTLFAKRTDVKESKDRYANMATNYLLQRLERYSGLIVLTTNLPKSIDDAFLRRLRFHVQFSLPDGDLRAKLWKTLLPPSAPIADNVDFEALGNTFELAGGHLKNAVRRAAFWAARRRQPIDHTVLFEAAVEECADVGMLVRV